MRKSMRNATRRRDPAGRAFISLAVFIGPFPPAAEAFRHLSMATAEEEN
jgi:hypothetical protein